MSVSSIEICQLPFQFNEGRNAHMKSTLYILLKTYTILIACSTVFVKLDTIPTSGCMFDFQYPPGVVLLNSIILITISRPELSRRQLFKKEMSPAIMSSYQPNASNKKVHQVPCNQSGPQQQHTKSAAIH
jgi:hypothetical protein